MCQHMPYVDLPAIEMNRGDQSVFVATDIENGEFPDPIHRSKHPLEFGKRAEIRLAHQDIPDTQRLCRIPVPDCKVS